MRLPKKIIFLNAVWEFTGANLRDKIPQILRDLRRFPRMKPDTAIIVHCYRVSSDQNTEGISQWENWKASRKR